MSISEIQESGSELAQPEEAAHGRDWIAYTAPMVFFMLLTMIEGRFKANYEIFYALKALIVTAVQVVCKKPLRDIRLDARVLLPAIVVGLLVCIEWVVVEHVVRYPHLGSRQAFNPFAGIHDPVHRAIFLTERFYVLALMVPVMEELFWRSFVIRWASDQDFWKLSQGTFTWGGFWIVVAGFSFEHPEWLAALICGVVYGLLLRRTKSLFACVVAHATTNFALGVYVMMSHDWRFW